MKKWIGIFVALALILALSLPVYAQRAKTAPMKMEDANKMMEDCIKMMETSMAKMKEMHEKMQKGDMKMDHAMMQKLKKDVSVVSDDVDKISKIGP